jgi:hypothetical protein
MLDVILDRRRKDVLDWLTPEEEAELKKAFSVRYKATFIPTIDGQADRGWLDASAVGLSAGGIAGVAWQGRVGGAAGEPKSAWLRIDAPADAKIEVAPGDGGSAIFWYVADDRSASKSATKVHKYVRVVSRKPQAAVSFALTVRVPSLQGETVRIGPRADVPVQFPY